MKDLFRKTTTSIILSSVAAFIIGLIMAVVPNLSLQAIGIAVGVYAMVYGVILMGINFTAHNTYIPFYGIASGILSIIVGLILVAMPNILSVVFAIALGIWIILSSVNIISIAITAKKTVTNWYLWLLLGIIDMICGIIILFNPFASSLSIVVLGGIIIMIHSVVSIIGMIMVKNNIKEVTKALETASKNIK